MKKRGSFCQVSGLPATIERVIVRRNKGAEVQGVKFRQRRQVQYEKHDSACHPCDEEDRIKWKQEQVNQHECDQSCPRISIELRVRMLF